MRIIHNYLLTLVGSINAGWAAYIFTGDPVIGVLVFGAAIGLVGALL